MFYFRQSDLAMHVDQILNFLVEAFFQVEDMSHGARQEFQTSIEFGHHLSNVLELVRKSTIHGFLCRQDLAVQLRIQFLIEFVNLAASILVAQLGIERFDIALDLVHPWIAEMFRSIERNAQVRLVCKPELCAMIARDLIDDRFVSHDYHL